MFYYSVFGESLGSELELPELREIGSAPATWLLRVSASPPDHDGWHLSGEQALQGVSARVYGCNGAFRFSYADQLCFDISPSGGEIVYYPNAKVDAELIRAAIVGPVLALALRAGGALCLHGSAVAVGENGIGFVAPKGHGKSTLAAAMVDRGARLLTDDTLVVDRGQPNLIRPGVQSLRLWEDSFWLLRDAAADVLVGTKHTLSGLPEAMLARESVPLRAIYLLDPIAPSPSTDVAGRERLAPAAALLALMGNAKLATLVGLLEEALLLRQIAGVAKDTPVFRLNYAHQFDRLPALSDLLLAWHS